jgi:hypothetical protein
LKQLLGARRLALYFRQRLVPCSSCFEFNVREAKYSVQGFEGYFSILGFSTRNLLCDDPGIDALGRYKSILALDLALPAPYFNLVQCTTCLPNRLAYTTLQGSKYFWRFTNPVFGLIRSHLSQAWIKLLHFAVEQGIEEAEAHSRHRI